ncbi:hypothetical protein [Hyalangium sp.]|uniref:hypothetical protein n=1 Tax=Hyalangium sp. TaxID=2028555 RepID=UPI002D6EC683|nr:hypothetical protein [Hyalangium sp.]HYI00565.1 hypothetical protein [Hyalangium sp.]
MAETHSERYHRLQKEELDRKAGEATVAAAAEKERRERERAQAQRIAELEAKLAGTYFRQS